MRQRTQHQYTDEQLKELYTGYDPAKWWDHRFRVELSSTMIARYCIEDRVLNITDLSAGDGSIVGGAVDYINKIHNLSFFDRSVQVGDFSRENGFKLSTRYDNVFIGKIERTIEEVDPGGLFVLSETIEHLEDPDEVLQNISNKFDSLFISTPLDETPGINPEHYWSWGKEDIECMIRTVGFTETMVYSEMDFGVSRYQIWLVRK